MNIRTADLSQSILLMERLRFLKEKSSTFWYDIGGVIAAAANIIVFLILCVITPWMLLPGVIISVLIILTWVYYNKKINDEIEKLKQGHVLAIDNLRTSVPTLFNSAAGGAQGYVSDISYKLLSKWIKEDHCSPTHPHLQSEIIDLRLALALLNLHHPQFVKLAEESGLPAGEFEFANVRNEGSAVLRWKLLVNGAFEFKLTHKDLSAIVS